MIKHIVTWKIKDNADGRSKAENIALLKQKLLTLKNVIPELLELEVGVNAAFADAANADIGIVSVFKNVEGLNAYLVHPEHKKVAEFIGSIRESRSCIDYEC